MHPDYRIEAVAEGQIPAESADTEMKGAKSGIISALRSQLEHYFSQSNLLRDKFLREKLLRQEKHKPFNCIHLSVFLTFKRI